MKSYLYIILFLIGTLSVSCEWDNYDEPDALLTGKLVYQGEPLGLSVGEVSFQLYEPGWQLKAPINVIVAQDGSFSALLFDASYKLVIPNNQGPFMNITTNGSDTILVDLRGKTTKDIEVVPYYMVRNPQFSVIGSKITASFKAEKIITDANGRDIEKVLLVLNNTTLVDGRNDYYYKDEKLNYSGKVEINGSDIVDPNSITLSLDAPKIVPSQNYFFVRVGIKIVGVEKLIYSPVEKLTIQ